MTLVINGDKNLKEIVFVQPDGKKYIPLDEISVILRTQGKETVVISSPFIQN
jgi:hypothetical protein